MCVQCYLICSRNVQSYILGTVIGTESQKQKERKRRNNRERGRKERRREQNKRTKGNLANWLIARVMESDILPTTRNKALRKLTSLCLSLLTFIIGVIIVQPPSVV